MRKNSTLPDKDDPSLFAEITRRHVAYGVGFMCLCAVVFAENIAPTLPDPELLTWAERYELVVSLAVFTVVLCGGLYCFEVTKKNVLGHLVIAAAFAFLTSDSLRYGVPALILGVSETQPASVELAVLERRIDTSGNYCRRGVYVEWYGRRVKVCKLRLDLWKGVEAGDVLILTGQEGRIGLRYTQVDRAE